MEGAYHIGHGVEADSAVAGAPQTHWSSATTDVLYGERFRSPHVRLMQR